MNGNGVDFHNQVDAGSHIEIRSRYHVVVIRNGSNEILAEAYRPDDKGDWFIGKVVDGNLKQVGTMYGRQLPESTQRHAILNMLSALG